MPSLQIQVGVEHHLTLVKFDELTEIDETMVDSIMADLMGKVQTTPNGVFGQHTMVGPYRNVKAIRISSAYMQQVHDFLKAELRRNGIPYSTQYGETFLPHVTRPLPEWQPGDEVPFATFMQLTRSSKPRAHYEMRG